MSPVKQLFVVSAVGVVLSAVTAVPRVLKADGRQRDGVHVLFDLHRRETGPFPTNIFTVVDPKHKTGRRVNLPYPDCAVRVSDCEDLDVINTLDGFGLQPRISIPFDGSIDPDSVSSDSVFLLDLNAGVKIGVNQVVWDPTTLTLHVESDALLEQHGRYGVIVTNRVLDAGGAPVQMAQEFRTYPSSERTPHWYKKDLDDAIRAAFDAGVQRQEVVAASVFTTMSITPVIERLRDEVKAGTPARANFLLGPAGERAVFNLAGVSSIQWRQQTGVSPVTFNPPTALDLGILQVVAGSIQTIGYASFESPQYVTRPDAILPAVGTLAETPPVQGSETVYLTVLLPSGTRPAGGWPVAIVAAPAGTSRNVGTHLLAAFNAAQGIATIGITSPGSAFGPESTLTVNLAAGGSLTFREGGRSYDQDGNNAIGGAEGSAAAPPFTWTVGDRDTSRQAALDLLQLVRVIQLGVDVDGDGSMDLDRNRIYFAGISGGSGYGTIFLALEPDVHTALLRPAGMSPEHGRWAPGRRASFLGTQLAARIPSLINPPGLPAIDGVTVTAPRFDENKPLRDRPSVTNTVTGAIAIQEAFELHEWGQQAGQSPILWAQYLRKAPLTGVAPKAVLLQFATADQQAVNPANLAFMRAGDLFDTATLYRHDLAFAIDPTIPKNPHMVPYLVTSPNALFRSVARGLQTQMATFFASQGTIVITPSPADLFEVPARGPFLEGLNFIQ